MGNVFIENLIQEIMDKVKEERLVNQMKKKGHIDNRCFKSDYIWKLSAAILLRIFVILAHQLDDGNNDEDFKRFFDHIRDEIIRIKNEHFDEFNDCHARK
ncbi:MAG: hypothetical protein IJQ04_07370 [Prevotella sp.]|nr:hypothetical protein [Prevotella sp.]